MPHDNMLLQIGAPETWRFRLGPDFRPCLRALPVIPWTPVLLTVRALRIDLQADGGVLLASGRLAYAPA